MRAWVATVRGNGDSALYLVEGIPRAAGLSAVERGRGNGWGRTDGDREMVVCDAPTHRSHRIQRIPDRRRHLASPPHPFPLAWTLSPRPPASPCRPPAAYIFPFHMYCNGRGTHTTVPYIPIRYIRGIDTVRVFGAHEITHACAPSNTVASVVSPCARTRRMVVRVTTALTLALAWTPATRHPVVDARAARSRVAAASCFARARASMLAGRRPTKRLAAKAAPADVAREKHLHFDEVEVLARGGHGGHGAVVSLPSRGDGPKLRRTSDDDFELPPGGGHGGDVVLYVDPALSDLLHLRATSTLCAARGGRRGVAF